MKPLHNAVAVQRFQGADLEDEHVKRPLKKLSVAGFVLPRHSSYEDNHGMPRMSRYHAEPWAPCEFHSG